MGIFHLRQLHDEARAAQGVARAGVAQLDDGAEIARAETGHQDPLAAIQDEELAQALGHLPGPVEQLVPAADLSGVDPEKGQLPHAGLVHRLEDVDDGIGLRERHRAGKPARVGGGHLGPVLRRRAVFRDEVHQARHADIALRGDREERDEHLVLDRLVEPGPQVVLAEDALGEEFLHQGVVGFGDVFHQLPVELVHALGQLAVGGLLLVLAVSAGLVGDDLVAQDVQDPAEARAGVERDCHGEDGPAEVLAGPGQDGIEIGVGLVQSIHRQDLGQAVMRRIVHYGVGAHPQAVGGVDDRQREVPDAQGADPLAQEVRVSGRVDDVELLPEPLGVQERGVDRDLVLVLARVVVGGRRARRDVAHAA